MNGFKNRFLEREYDKLGSNFKTSIESIKCQLYKEKDDRETQIS